MSDDNTPSVKVFISSLSVNKEVKLQQQRIIQTLDAKKIAFEKKDIAVDQQAKREFRRLTRGFNQNGTTPQIFNGDYLCGDYEAFYWAVEEERLHEFVRLTAPPGTKPAQAAVYSTSKPQSASISDDEETRTTAPETDLTVESETSKRHTMDNIPPPPLLGDLLLNNHPTQATGDQITISSVLQNQGRSTPPPNLNQAYASDGPGFKNSC